MGPNYTAKIGHVVIREGAREIGALDPAVRFYPTRQMSRAEAGIKTLNFGQVYVGISDGVKPGTVDARLYWKPLVAFIWIGGLIMGFRRPCLAERPAAAHRRRASRPQTRGGAAGGGMKRALQILVLVALVVAPLLARAVEPAEMLPDPHLEARARAISAGLRCLVCQNELIDESNATLAHDIRVLVRERLLAGDSDQQIRDFLVSRYGNFILLKPPFEPGTISCG